MKSSAKLPLTPLFAAAAALLLGSVAPAAAPDIHNVYVLPMPGGLDQHLADRITRNHLYQVVTDPHAADAFLTTRIGPSFEQSMAGLFPPATEEKETSKKDAGSGGTSVNHGGLKSTTSGGTIFLVDARSRQVVWSDFEVTSNSTPKALDREAGRIAKKLAALAPKSVATK